MAVKRNKTSTASTGFNWSPELEAAMLQSILSIKPTGINKHLSLALAVENVGKGITAEMILEHMETFWDMEQVEKREKEREIQLEEFSLPKKDFSNVIREMRREGKISTEKDNAREEEEQEQETMANTPSTTTTSSTTKGTKRPTRSTPNTTPAAKRKRMN